MAKGKYLIPALVLLFMIFLLVMPTRAWSQDDGAWLYMVIPDETTIASMRVQQSGS